MHLIGNLCVSADLYLIANCCIHSMQLQLSNAVKNTLGEGALDRVNAMQLLHSIYQLQESLDLEEWRHILYQSSEFVASYDPDAPHVTSTTPTQRELNKAAFLEEFAKVYAFHSSLNKAQIDLEAKIAHSILQKMQVPILTRWWTVGVASYYAFDYYLQVFYACQMVINLYSSESTPYKIASSLFALMKDQENFVDITLIRCFHKAYVNPHFDWLQSCVDLTGTIGFQAHNIVVRYYLMEKDLQGIYSHPVMKVYREAVSNHTNKPLDTIEGDPHMEKLKAFIRPAYDSLSKHFGRWVEPSLLPAGLMSQSVGIVVAAALLNQPVPAFQECNRFTGKVLKDTAAHGPIDLIPFDRFL